MRFGLPQTSLSRGANQPVNGNSKTPVPHVFASRSNVAVEWQWQGKVSAHL